MTWHCGLRVHAQLDNWSQSHKEGTLHAGTLLPSGPPWGQLVLTLVPATSTEASSCID